MKKSSVHPGIKIAIYEVLYYKIQGSAKGSEDEAVRNDSYPLLRLAYFTKVTTFRRNTFWFLQQNDVIDSILEPEKIVQLCLNIVLQCSIL